MAADLKKKRLETLERLLKEGKISKIKRRQVEKLVEELRKELQNPTKEQE